MSTSVLQKRKKDLKSELIQIEKQIYDLETSYLEETRDFGNVFSGWESYLSSEKTKVKKNINFEDRHFSLSSVTSPASRKEENKLKSKAGESGRKKKRFNKDKPGDAMNQSMIDEENAESNMNRRNEQENDDHEQMV